MNIEDESQGVNVLIRIVDIPWLGLISVPKEIFNECLSILEMLHFWSATTSGIRAWFSVDKWPSDDLIDQNVIVRTIWNGESHGITPKILDHPLCGHFVSWNGGMETRLIIFSSICKSAIATSRTLILFAYVVVPYSHLQASGGISWCIVHHHQLSLYVVICCKLGGYKWPFDIQFHAHPKWNVIG